MKLPDVLNVLDRPSGKLYFRLGAGKQGGEPVTVVRTLQQTYVCLTCVTADTCVHARSAAAYYDEHQGVLAAATAHEAAA